jgi:hypothetical protein
LVVAGRQLNAGQYPISIAGVLIIAALLILNSQLTESAYGQCLAWTLFVCAVAVIIGFSWPR